jgi:hypothetical protein
VVHRSLAAEAEFSEPVRKFAVLHNKRHPSPAVGQQWVRLRPSTVQEIEDLAKAPACIKFYRVGSLVRITELPTATGFFEVSCAGDKMLLAIDAFLGSYVRAVPEEDWRHSALRDHDQA